MQIVRSIFAFLFAFLLQLSLFLLLTFMAILTLVGTPKVIKQALADSGIYDNLISNVLTTATKNSGNPSGQASQNEGQQLPFDNPDFLAAVNKAVPPAFIHQTVDQILDGTYHWLDGKSAQPDFKIDITETKRTFTDAVADYAVKRVETLPVCPKGQQIQGDLFETACRPIGFNAQTEKQKIIDNVSSEEGFLKESVITIDSLQTKKGENGEAGNKDTKPFTEKFEAAPKVYKFLKLTPIIFSIASVVCIGLVFLLSTDHRKALKKLSNIFITTGATTLVFALIYWFLFNALNKPTGKLGQAVDSSIQANVIRGLSSAFSTFIKTLIIGSVIYIVIGLILWLIRKRFLPEDPLSEEQKENNINTILKTKQLNDEGAVELSQDLVEKPKTKIDIEPKDK